MSGEIKSGKVVLDEFFSEIYNVNNADKDTLDALVKLYDDKRLTDTNLQNALDDLLSKQLKK